MASSVNPSSFSYSFIAGTTQMFTTTIPGGPGNTSPTPVVSTDSVSGTHGPPPEITATNSFTTISNATATDVVPATLSNNITSPVPTVTSFSVTTVDGSTGALTGTATTTATFGDATSTAASETSTVTTSTGIEQGNSGSKAYEELFKNKMVVLMLVAAVVNFGFAAM
ncbi:hypothetical protein PMZ80_004643 [Knufia obscura]|uniref:Uncharacterized protein n=1 Tax=Knufia obscura TaxID=1635080 RepID=A0ABR0RSR5_9EURO|nr:hypothetical protein PMZ80_004643 [Knufia obscura]